MRIRWAVPLAATVLAVLPVGPPAQATVLAAGRVTTDFVGGEDTAQAVAIQADGKIIAAGGAGNLFELVRYNPNGSLDTTFGQGGRVTTRVGSGVSPSASAFAVAVQRDGRIVAGGWQASGGFSFPRAALVLVRYDANGSLDASFSGDGIASVIINDDDPINRVEDLAILDDGRIVTVGFTSGGIVTLVARFTADGSLDTTFDADGFTKVGFGGAANAVLVQGDGRVVAVGNSSSNFGLARYEINGALDASFGAGGRVVTDFSGAADVARAAVLQSDGRIVAGGFTTPAGGLANFALARYNANGSLDATFGQGGKVVTDFAGTEDVGWGAVLQGDGRIVLAGRSGNDFALARYNANGSLDATFGQGGKVVTDFAGTIDGGLAAALQRDGRIVVAGASVNTGTDFALARYNPDGSLDATFGG